MARALVVKGGVPDANGDIFPLDVWVDIPDEVVAEEAKVSKENKQKNLAELLKKAALGDKGVLAKLIEYTSPRRNLLDSIFQTQPLPPGAEVRFPLDFMPLADEKEYVAYTIPGCKFVPERTIFGGELEQSKENAMPSFLPESKEEEKS